MSFLPGPPFLFFFINPVRPNTSASQELVSTQRQSCLKITKQSSWMFQKLWTFRDKGILSHPTAAQAFFPACATLKPRLIWTWKGVTPISRILKVRIQSEVSHPQPRPVGYLWPRMAMNAAQHKITNLLKTFFFAHDFSLVFVYLTCGQRQHFFQCGPEVGHPC